MSQRKRSLKMLMVAGLVAVCARGVSATIIVDTVPVGDSGNAGDSRFGSHFGSVGYTYQMGKYEVTAGQYTAFLNAVAATDSYGLYRTDMDTAVNPHGCNIQRSGSSGSYSYSVAADWANRPVNYVSWPDSARFANWMHNGQPTGAQNLSTTEDGAYFLNGATSDAALLAVTRNSNATWVIPTRDEWYKAAYYKSGSPNAGYWNYATSNDSAPGRDLADVSGNNANFNNDSLPYPIDNGHYTTIVGEFQNSDSSYGTFDQGGNVWEWNETVALNTGFGNLSRGLRGGSFNSSLGDMLAPGTNLETYYVISEGSDIGFRVSVVPEPSSLAMLALGAALLGRRRSHPCKP